MSADYTNKLTSYFETVLSQGASDLHLSIGRKPMIRVAKMLVPLEGEAELKAEDTYGVMEALLNEGQKQRFLETKEIDFSYAYKDKARFRCNCFVQQGAVGIALRLIPSQIKTLEELRLPESLAHFAQLEQGFFLVVGPVGQGKTTTLAAMIELINQERAEHVITIEDPIEYMYVQKKSMIDQREVGIDTADFHTALKSVFRQDVDVVLVGEMRDSETIATAVTAAETGHLVFSTLHTNNAAQTINRIIDSFPAEQQDQIRVQLSGSLSGIFSQRLLPRISGGVVPAYELLINNNAIANLIREERIHEIDSVIETSAEQGMVSMNRSLAELVRAGEVTVDNAKRFSLSPKILEGLI